MSRPLTIFGLALLLAGPARAAETGAAPTPSPITLKALALTPPKLRPISAEVDFLRTAFGAAAAKGQRLAVGGRKVTPDGSFVRVEGQLTDGKPYRATFCFLKEGERPVLWSMDVHTQISPGVIIGHQFSQSGDGRLSLINGSVIRRGKRYQRCTDYAPWGEKRATHVASLKAGVSPFEMLSTESGAAGVTYRGGELQSHYRGDLHVLRQPVAGVEGKRPGRRTRIIVAGKELASFTRESGASRVTMAIPGSSPMTLDAKQARRAYRKILYRARKDAR